jgi:hypothetical protein
LPFLGHLKTHFRLRYSGLFLDTWQEFDEKLAHLSRLVPRDLLFSYAKTYGVDYIGLEGDRRDGTWSPGCLASLGQGRHAEQHLCLNPELDTADIAHRLSQELGEPMQPSEVYLFLFLHEIGHTRKAGNQCYVTALINYTLSGGRHSSRQRQELRRLQQQIEEYADRFALRELQRWRQQQGQHELVGQVEEARVVTVLA